MTSQLYASRLDIRGKSRRYERNCLLRALAAVGNKAFQSEWDREVIFYGEQTSLDAKDIVPHRIYLCLNIHVAQ